MFLMFKWVFLEADNGSFVVYHYSRSIIPGVWDWLPMKSFIC